ncbi:hypothetical protein F5876DRAFT_66072 [Lentinula aff. lateritia]|uniref:Uncharacterized protein n=1 Tax=Lentinula aff. lateritia TaxID=2804960 RepID=A0ACC1TYW5_9AGAR|nr:hypothetical protein F5876DRAFT_66072 [Lentinula aff. lateritia]
MSPPLTRSRSRSKSQLIFSLPAASQPLAQLPALATIPASPSYSFSSPLTSLSVLSAALGHHATKDSSELPAASPPSALHSAVLTRASTNTPDKQSGNLSAGSVIPATPSPPRSTSSMPMLLSTTSALALNTPAVDSKALMPPSIAQPGADAVSFRSHRRIIQGVEGRICSTEEAITWYWPATSTDRLELVSPTLPSDFQPTLRRSAMVQTGIKAPICFDGIPMKLKRIAHSIEHEELNGTYAFVCAIRSCKYWNGHKVLLDTILAVHERKMIFGVYSRNERQEILISPGRSILSAKEANPYFVASAASSAGSKPMATASVQEVIEISDDEGSDSNMAGLSLQQSKPSSMHENIIIISDNDEDPPAEPSKKRARSPSRVQSGGRLCHTINVAKRLKDSKGKGPSSLSPDEALEARLASLKRAVLSSAGASSKEINEFLRCVPACDNCHRRVFETVVHKCLQRM